MHIFPVECNLGVSYVQTIINKPVPGHYMTLGELFRFYEHGHVGGLYSMQSLINHCTRTCYLLCTVSIEKNSKIHLHVVVHRRLHKAAACA